MEVAEFQDRTLAIWQRQVIVAKTRAGSLRILPCSTEIRARSAIISSQPIASRTQKIRRANDSSVDSPIFLWCAKRANENGNNANRAPVPGRLNARLSFLTAARAPARLRLRISLRDATACRASAAATCRVRTTLQFSMRARAGLKS
jgi:hypothetical protein